MQCSYQQWCPDLQNGFKHPRSRPRAGESKRARELEEKRGEERRRRGVRREGRREESGREGEEVGSERTEGRRGKEKESGKRGGKRLTSVLVKCESGELSSFFFFLRAWDRSARSVQNGSCTGTDASSHPTKRQIVYHHTALAC